MKAIILAAGEGKRMRPLTLVKPKPMIEVLGKPLLQWITESLPSEITELIIIIGYKGDQIRSYFGNTFGGRKVTYVVQDEQLGTGHALELCRPHIKSGERFLFMIGDDLHSSAALKKLLRHPFAMLVHEHPDPKRFGVVEVDKNNKVIGFEEKPLQPKSNLVSPAVFVLDDRIFNYPKVKHRTGEFFAVDQINQMMKDYSLIAERSDFWHPVGYPHDIDKAEEILLKQGKGEKMKYDTLVVLLCGGKGTRLPISAKDTQKILVEVAGKPIVQHQIDHLKKQGFSRIRLALGHRAEMVIEYLKRTSQTDIEYTVEAEPLGTGGGIKFAMKDEKKPFLAFNADVLADHTVPAILRAGGNGQFTVIAGVELQDVSGFGILECDEYKKICAFKEKIAEKIPGLINAGAYLLNPEDFQDMPEAFSIEYDLFPKLAAASKIVLHQHRGNYWFDTGTEERLKIVRDYFAKNLK